MKNLRLIVIGWMLLWLTGNGALAALMPFCEHPPGHSNAMAVAHHDHDRSAAGQAMGKGKHSTLLAQLCDNCDLCHLTASVLPCDLAPRGPSLPNACRPQAPIAQPASHFPDPPQHVPLALAA